MVPIMQTLVLPLISDRLGPLFQNEVKKVWLATMGIDLVNLVFLTNAFPNTVAFVKQGDASGALLAFWNEIVTSNTLQDLLKSSISAFITASVGPDQLPLTVYDSAGNIHGVNLLGTDLPGKVAQFQAGFARVAKTIVLVKAALTVADFAAMGKDWASSAHRSQFQLASSGTTIAITPAALSALPGQSVQLSAALGETADLGAGSVIRYEWSVSGSAGGSLRNPASQSAGTTITSSTGTVDYVAAAGAAPGATDQVDVKAILTDIGTQGGGAIAVAMKPAVVTISAVRLTPSSVEFKRMLSGQRQDFIVEFSTAFGSPTGLVYEWSCPSVSGFISDNAQLSSTAAPSFRSTLAKVVYSSGAAIEAEAVKVRVLRITSAPGAVTETTETIATLESNVTYGNIALGINPSTPTDMPTDSSMGITAFVKEPPLPPGSTVIWAWSLLGAGSRVDVPDDANLADNSVTFNSASTEGPVTLTVHATIVVPVSGAQQAYTIITDPVSTTLNVKKGLKTVTVEGYFQLEQGSKPLAVPQCGLDAQGKEGCLLGYLDTWGTYIVPKVANAETYSISLLNPAGGSVYTYDVPSRYQIGGPVVQDGGGTLRIRFRGSDSPYGSYDGVSNYGITQATQSAYIVRRARTELPRVVAVVTLKP